SENRPAVAKALLQMGQCYEKLGNAEAREAYERVLRDYAEQAEQVGAARARLAALTQPANTTSVSTMVVRRVWKDLGADYFGRPSPDGRYLIYVDMETGDLAVYDLVTGEKRSLTGKGSDSAGVAGHSVVSPDGQQVAYTWNEHDLRLIGLDGSGPRLLYQNEELTYLIPRAWSPDGRDILALFRRNDGTSQIALVSTADGSARVLKSLEWRWPRGQQSFSPDGRYIAYDSPTRQDSPEHDIFLLSTDGSREIPLVEHPADDFVLGWAPDGKRVLFASDRMGTLGAWAIPVAHGKPQGSPELVKPDMGQGVFAMGFTRKGSYYYETHTVISDVYVVTLDPATGKLAGAPKKVSESFVGSNYGPDWSPDGQYLSYVRRRENDPSGFPERGSTIVIRSLQTGEERELSPKLQDLLGPRWSPDGRFLLIPGTDPKTSRWGLFRMDPQTGDVAALVESRPGSWMVMPEWSPKGEAIFYMLHEDSELPAKKESIVMRNLKTGQEKKLYSASHIHAWALSPDGRQLVFTEQATRPGEQWTVLKVMPASGGEPRELLRLPESEYVDWLEWTVDGRHVFFTRSEALSPVAHNRPIPLWRMPAEGGEPDRMELAMQGLRQMRFHPDGRRIAFTDGHLKVEVWVMENFLPELSSTF
ncbi:MAG: hypothetical protein V3R29_05400, partial [Candidatus Acidoferrales bacterium]